MRHEGRRGHGRRRKSHSKDGKESRKVGLCERVSRKFKDKRVEDEWVDWLIR